MRVLRRRCGLSGVKHGVCVPQFERRATGRRGSCDCNELGVRGGRLVRCESEVMFSGEKFCGRRASRGAVVATSSTVDRVDRTER